MPCVQVKAHSIIIATGAIAKRLGLPHEEEFWNSGISACAVCDGASANFRKQELAVVGGGDTAAEEALYLTKYGTKVSMPADCHATPCKQHMHVSRGVTLLYIRVFCEHTWGALAFQCFCGMLYRLQPHRPEVLEACYAQVHLLVRSSKMRASAAMQDRVLNHEKVEVHYSTEVADAYGDKKGLKGLQLRDTSTGW